MRNTILKSFETFVATPFSILRNKIINVVSLKTNLTDTQSVSVEILKDSLQINVVNSEKMYNLLSSVMYKRRLNELNKGKSEVEIFAS